MPRPATGQVQERVREGGRVVYALRFRANGKRRYVTLGSADDGWTRERAEQRLADELALVRMGRWTEPAPAPTPVEPETGGDPGFHEFASEWLAQKKAAVEENTYRDYEATLAVHLLPFFKDHRLSQITAREVDRYRLHKVAEREANDSAREAARARADKPPAVRGLSANQINKTITRLGQILELAVEYGLIQANPARGRNRRLRGTRPRRPFVSPEQLPALLDASGRFLHGRGRPLLATLAGAGLRIGEALDLRWRNVNLARGTLTVDRSKTDAGVRVVDLTPALREELALWRDRTRFPEPTHLVFANLKGEKDNRQNVRRRLLVRAIEEANEKLVGLGIDPIGRVSPHGLRRTYASLRVAAGDDPVYVSGQLGHADHEFTLNVYAQVVKHRERLTAAERAQYARAVEWASMAAPAGEPLIALPVAVGV